MAYIKTVQSLVVVVQVQSINFVDNQLNCLTNTILPCGIPRFQKKSDFHQTGNRANGWVCLI